MKGRRTAAGLALVLLGGCQDRRTVASAGDPAPPLATPSVPAAPRPTATPRLERDLLRYGNEAVASAPPLAAPAPPDRPSAQEPPTPAATPPPLRLVGFVRRAGQLCAALALGSEGLAVLCPGERAARYRLLSVDEERGVRLVLPDGSESELPAPR